MIRALPLCLLATPVLAGNSFVPPVGCEGTLTVQSRDCSVTHVYVCGADAPGVTWSVTFDAEGPVFVDKIDYETQWLETYNVIDGVRETLILPADDPASLTELLDSGIDSYDFRLDTPEGDVRVVGFDQIVGETTTIDDEPLLPMVFEGRYEDATGVFMPVSGTQYVSSRHRRFFAGTFVTTEGGDTTEWDASPVEFIYPGEPGFFDTTPRYECNPTLARFAPEPEGDL